MVEAPISTIDIARDAGRAERYRWNVHVQHESPYSFATKREAQIDANKFVIKLNGIWRKHQ